MVRTLLVLERAGTKQVFLLAEREHRDAIAAELARHGRLHMPCTIVEDRGESLAKVAENLAGCPADTHVMIWPGALSLGRRAPDFGVPPMEEMRMGCDSASGQDHGLVLASAALLGAYPDHSVSTLATQLARAGKLGRVPLPGQAVTVLDPASARQAERVLLSSLRKNADGVVARFDRYLSLAISRHLLALPIRPNHVTLFAALVGIACGCVVAQGGYAWMLVGALVFQGNSILDGVDGEIARAKLLESPTGEWLDTLADDLSNLAFMLGASVGSYRTWGSPLYLALGAVAGTGFLITSTIMYHFLITRAHSGDLNDFVMPWLEGAGQEPDGPTRAQSPVSRLLARVQWLFRRDTYVFLCTLFALVGQLRMMVWLFALGTTATWVSITAYRVVGRTSHSLSARQGSRGA
jgi:phosphatidylglycerophosphate synthase